MSESKGFFGLPQDIIDALAKYQLPPETCRRLAELSKDMEKFQRLPTVQKLRESLHAMREKREREAAERAAVEAAKLEREKREREAVEQAAAELKAAKAAKIRAAKLNKGGKLLDPKLIESAQAHLRNWKPAWGHGPKRALTEARKHLGNPSVSEVSDRTIARWIVNPVRREKGFIKSRTRRGPG